MAQKYEIFNEVGWDDALCEPKYEKLTTVKNMQSAIDFVNSLDNIGRYGNMIIKMKGFGSPVEDVNFDGKNIATKV